MAQCLRLALIGMAATVVMISNTAMAVAAHQCELARARGDASVSEYYDPRIAEIDGLAKKGMKLDDVKVKVTMANGQDEWLSLAEVRERLVNQRQVALQVVSAAISDCDHDLKPYQEVMDAFVLIATGGLSELLPKRMTHIDVSDIIAGYPLGQSSDAFIPKLREQILGGDRSTPANILRDPWKCLTGQRTC